MLLQYIEDRTVGKPKQDVKYLMPCLHESFKDQCGMDNGFKFYPRHGAGLDFFTQCAIEAQGDPNRVYIAALFLNDFVGPRGGVRWDHVANALKPGSPLQLFLEEFKKLPHKVLLVGANAKVWGVGDDYDDIVETVVANARTHGIPTVRGTRCWIRMPLVRGTKQGKVMTWHVQSSVIGGKILATYLKTLYSVAINFNPPSDTWISEVLQWSSVRRGDPASTQSVGKPWLGVSIL